MIGLRASQDSNRNDAGFTLVEVTIVIVIMGMLMAALAMAISITLRTAPDTEARIDDARSTRGLATWLSYDTTSTPPFLPEKTQGGIDLTTSPTANNNDCGGQGSNIVHLQWTEKTTATTVYVANYRFVVDAGVGKVIRYACFKTGTGSFVPRSQQKVAPDLDGASPPTASATFNAAGNVTEIAFTLTGKTGETVLVETSSRNPSDFFP